MWYAIGTVTVFCFLFGLIVLLARKEGSKSAKLEAIKAELKRKAEEEAYAEKIANSVYNLDDDTARNRLHQVANSYNRTHLQ